MKEALYYKPLDGQKVQCLLCPNFCIIKHGQRGSCFVRENRDGKLYSLIYGRYTSIALDPIEKKPLYRFHKGEKILSIGTKGCNFHCPFCQNRQISQDAQAPVQNITPEELTAEAERINSFGIAYTYNEPFIWFEFILDTAKSARKKGLKNVLVTNGYVNEAPLKELLPLIDAMNIDIKSIDAEFYKKYCGGIGVEPILKTAKISKESGCHIELTNLIIPGLNDTDENFRNLANWIHDNLSPETPLHLSAYFPQYKMTLPPTPISTLKRAQELALKKLKYVYLGNV